MSDGNGPPASDNSAAGTGHSSEPPTPPAATPNLAGLARVLDQTTDGIILIDADRRCVYANSAAGHVLGRPVEPLLDHDLLDNFGAADHDRILAHLPMHLGEAAPPFLCVLPGPEDGERDVLCTTFALDTTDDSHCVMILRDLSDPGAAARTATALVQSDQPLRTGTTEQILSGIARHATDETRALTCGIVVVGEDHKLVAAGGYGFPSTPASREAWTASSVTLEDLPGGDILLTNTRVALADARSAYQANPVLAGFAASMETLDWQGVVYAPLSRDGRVFGVLAAYLPTAVTVPTEAELSYYSALADQAAVVVINARMAASLERSRLARELHDSVSQALFSMTMHARAAQLSMTKVGLDESAPLGRSISQLVELTRGALAEMRALIFELRPGALAEEGLVAALGKHAAALSFRELMTMTVDGPEQRLALATGVEEHLYRIASEALHNVVKHAQATAATVTVAPEPGVLRLTVHDNGAGFDPMLRRAGHLGLSTMAQRAEAIGAELTITSSPGAGTTVEISLPHIRPDDKQAA